jgi:hypothetical protein
MRSVVTVVVVAGLFVAGCAAGVDTIGIKLAEHTRFEILWDRYGRLPGNKAFALAGDPTGINAMGLVYGMGSGDAAREKALDYCEEQRLVRRIDAPCVLLAIDDNVLAASLPARRAKGS